MAVGGADEPGGFAGRSALVALDVVEVFPKDVGMGAPKEAAEVEALFIEREGASEQKQGGDAEDQGQRKAVVVDGVEVAMEDGGSIRGKSEGGEGKAAEKEKGNTGAEGVDQDGAVLVAIGMGCAATADKRGEETKEGFEQEVHGRKDRWVGGREDKSRANLEWSYGYAGAIVCEGESGAADWAGTGRWISWAGHAVSNARAA